jgi:hypothetical protein
LINKPVKGRKRVIIAIVEGTEAGRDDPAIDKLPKEQLDVVEEVTLDMLDSMRKIIRLYFLKDSFEAYQPLPCSTLLLMLYYKCVSHIIGMP